MTLTETVVKRIIKKLVKGEDYRIEIITLINAEFLQYAVQFFKKIVNAKLENEDISIDWYKKEFLSDKLRKDEIAINSGLNMKTITNMYNSEKKEIVLDASQEHYEILYQSINDLLQTENEIDLTLTIKLKQVSVELTINESLIVINALAVKRAALRGGLWSTAGKRVEKYLMLALCHIYSIPDENFSIKFTGKKSEEKFEREIDFYMIDKDNEYLKCEVKLMGKGNPESADAVIARDSKIFIADKLSQTNKDQLDSLNVHWVELRAENGFKRFEKLLDYYDIPHKPYNGNIDKDIDSIFKKIFVK